MSDPLEHVTPGDPLAIRADTFNLLLDAGKFVRDRRLGKAGGGQALDDPVTPSLQVYVRNDTGASLPAFSVVALGTPVISATDAQHTVRRQPVFPGTAPAASADAFAITIEPLADDKIGRAVVMGIVPVDLAVTDAAHTAAIPAASVTATLASANVGPAKIIWKATGTGTKRAVVLIGRDTAGGSATLSYGDSTTTASGSVSSDDTWTSATDFDLVLPAAGTYLVVYHASVAGRVSAIGGSVGGIIYTRLYDATNAAAVPGTVAMAGQCQVVDQYVYTTATLSKIITVTGSTTIRFQMYRSSAVTWSYGPQVIPHTDFEGNNYRYYLRLA